MHGDMLPERKPLARAKTTYHANAVSGICVRPQDIVALVASTSEIAEKLFEQRVNYLLTALIESEAAFSRIGDGPGFMNEHVVPRLIPVRLGFIGPVPILIGHALGVMRHHHTAVLITHVTNQIARRELWQFAILQIGSQHDHGE
jgi:hypothetical protein